MVIGSIITCLSLIFIAIQDFISRSVYWWLFVTLFVGSCLLIPNISGNISVTNVLVNACILLMVFSLAGIYFIVSYKKESVNKIKKSIGLGDLLLIPVLLISFSPLNFLLFFIVSLLIALTGHIISQLWQSRSQTIPLAGYWSIFLLICYLGAWFGIFSLNDDNWIYLWL